MRTFHSLWSFSVNKSKINLHDKLIGLPFSFLVTYDHFSDWFLANFTWYSCLLILGLPARDSSKKRPPHIMKLSNFLRLQKPRIILFLTISVQLIWWKRRHIPGCFLKENLPKRITTFCSRLITTEFPR